MQAFQADNIKRIIAHEILVILGRKLCVFNKFRTSIPETIDYFGFLGIYEKIVLSMDRSFINSYDGIKSLNLIDWLLAESNQR